MADVDNTSTTDVDSTNHTTAIVMLSRNATTITTYHFHGAGWVTPMSFLMTLFIVMSVAGNVMVVITIVRHRGMRTRTNMFIVNLAVADILVAVLDMPVSLYTIVAGDWVFGKVLCQLNGFTMALFLICSIHTLMYIAIHKYISITRPFSRAMTPKRIKMMIAAAWIWSTVCALGPILGWNSIIYKKGASQCGPDIPRSLPSVTHSLFITTSNYFIPLSVMCFCYYRIFREIHSHMHRIRETSNIDLNSSVTQQKKVSITLLLVLTCFVICWTPFVAYSTALSFMKDKSKMPYVINPLAYWCGYFNSACNPVIYAFRSPSFRKGYMEIMCGKIDALNSGVHSMSFRNKSQRGSLKNDGSKSVKNNTLKRQEGMTSTRPRKMLSQTSWVSLPIVPYLLRSVSSVKRQENDNHSISSGNSEHISYCCFECRRKERYTCNEPNTDDKRVEKPGENIQIPDTVLCDDAPGPSTEKNIVHDLKENRESSVDYELSNNLNTSDEENA